MLLAIDVRERRVVADMVSKGVSVGDPVPHRGLAEKKNGRGLNGVRPVALRCYCTFVNPNLSIAVRASSWSRST
jgi:hypothetical protein